MDDGHPSFTDHPDEGDHVWRYMDLARYLSLLDSSALHFARADQMADRWEGSFGPANVALRPQLYGDRYEAMFTQAPQRRLATLQRTHMNCWHANEYESAAMWDIYQREGRGVAIRSTWGALTNSITAERMVYGGRVQYVDYAKTFIPEGNAFDAFMYKRLSFAHEREVRLIMLTGHTAPHPTQANIATDLGPEEPVIPVSVDLDQLVEAVYVSPDAPPWIAEVISNLTGRYGYSFTVLQSDLAQDPIA